ncbi:MAG: hypothetical protein IJ682_10865 [Lachnospiraceae bacterium]|nr:hypothetical protein [Lachnospiraceae bacterium]
MATNTKEYNGYLFDQLELVERVLKVAHETNDVEKIIEAAEYEKRLIERKLYQDPGLVGE